MIKYRLNNAAQDVSLIVSFTFGVKFIERTVSEVGVAHLCLFRIAHKVKLQLHNQLSDLRAWSRVI